MAETTDIKRLKSLADEIGIGLQIGGLVREAVYFNDRLIDQFGQSEVEALEEKLKEIKSLIDQIASDEAQPKVEIPEGASVSFESRETAEGTVEGRTVIAGRWAELEKPSGLS